MRHHCPFRDNTKSLNHQVFDDFTANVFVDALQNFGFVHEQLLFKGPAVQRDPQLTSRLQSYAAGLPIDHIPKACFPSQNNIHLVEFALHAIDSNKLFNGCFQGFGILGAHVSKLGAVVDSCTTASPFFTSNTRTSAPVAANNSGMRPRSVSVMKT